MKLCVFFLFVRFMKYNPNGLSHRFNRTECHFDNCEHSIQYNTCTTYGKGQDGQIDSVICVRRVCSALCIGIIENCFRCHT